MGNPSLSLTQVLEELSRLGFPCKGSSSGLGFSHPGLGFFSCPGSPQAVGFQALEVVFSLFAGKFLISNPGCRLWFPALYLLCLDTSSSLWGILFTISHCIREGNGLHQGQQSLSGEGAMLGLVVQAYKRERVDMMVTREAETGESQV